MLQLGFLSILMENRMNFLTVWQVLKCYFNWKKVVAVQFNGFFEISKNKVKFSHQQHTDKTILWSEDAADFRHSRWLDMVLEITIEYNEIWLTRNSAKHGWANLKVPLSSVTGIKHRAHKIKTQTNRRKLSIFPVRSHNLRRDAAQFCLVASSKRVTGCLMLSS